MTEKRDKAWWGTEEQAQQSGLVAAALGFSRRDFLKVLAATSALSIACGRADRRRRLRWDPSTVKRQQERRGEPVPDDEQMVRVGLWADPISHDWNKMGAAGGIPELFAPLLTFDQDYGLLLWAAERMTVSADGTKYTLRLRKDATWTNGLPVTADDWVYSFTRILQPATKAPHAPLYYDIAGAQEFHTGKTDDPKRLGLRALDRFTFEITLNQPVGYFPVLLALWSSCPAYQPAVQKFGDQWTEAGKIVSNGPFKLTKWERGKGLIVERRSDWWSALPKPKLREVRYSILSPEDALAAYEAGDVDAVTISASDIRSVLDAPQLREELVLTPLFSTWYLIGETGQRPFDDIRVRRALAKAIDQDLIATRVLRGQARPAYGLMPPGSPGYLGDDDEIVQAQRFDPKAALALLRGTPYEGGKNWPRITLAMEAGRDSARSRPAAEAIQQMLSRHLRMPMQLEVVDKQTLLDRLQTPGRKGVQLAFLSWTAEYPHPHDALLSVLSGGRPEQRHFWWDAEVAAQVRLAARETDMKKRLELYQQISKEIVLEHAALTCVLHMYNGVMYKPYVHGVAVNSQGEFVPPNSFYRTAFSRDLYIART